MASVVVPGRTSAALNCSSIVAYPWGARPPPSPGHLTGHYGLCADRRPRSRPAAHSHDARVGDAYSDCQTSPEYGCLRFQAVVHARIRNLNMNSVAVPSTRSTTSDNANSRVQHRNCTQRTIWTAHHCCEVENYRCLRRRGEKRRARRHTARVGLRIAQ